MSNKFAVRNPKSEATPAPGNSSVNSSRENRTAWLRPRLEVSDFFRKSDFGFPIFPILLAIALLPAPTSHAQGLGATMTTALVATQGQTLTYTVVITNGTGDTLTGVRFNDVLDPNTTLVTGSINTSPLAFPETYSALGNVRISHAAPGVLANDVDPDAVGPALTVAAGSFNSANGGDVVLTANGAFSYNPPPGFEGTDTFTYTLNDGEGFTDTGTVTLNVTGMIWFVNSTAPGGGDGRLTAPFNSITSLASINNGTGNNPAANDSIFLYSGTYTGPLTLLNNQKLIGQGGTATLAALTGQTPPAGSLALPATGGARPTLGGSAGLTLASGNFVRGLNFNQTGGTSLAGGSVGALTVAEVAIANSAGIAVNLAGGALNVTLDSVTATGAANGIALANTTGSFTVTGNGALAQNGSGGTIQNTTGNAVHLNNVANVSLARMNINNSLANGIFGQNVHGFILDWCSLNNNGDATGEGGIRMGNPLAAVNGLTGTFPTGANPTRIANTLIRASGEMNAVIFNNGGTLAQLEVTNVVSKDTRTRPLGADGFLFEVRGNGRASVNFSSCSFSNNFTQGIQAAALTQSFLTVNVANCGFTNNNEGVVLANANDATLIYDLNGNRFFNNLPTGASGAAIAAVNATTVTPAAIYSGKIRNNTISGGGIDNHLIAVLLAGAGQNTLAAQNNTVNSAIAQFSGLFLQAGETGSGNLNANVTVTGNNVTLGALGSHGMVIQSRITSSLCAEIANNISITPGVGLFGINVRQRDTSTCRLPGFVGPFNSTAAVIAFLQGKNAGSTIGSTVATAYSGGSGACALPLLAMSRSADFRSAASRVSNPPTLDVSTHVGNLERVPIGNRRHSRLETCATAEDRDIAHTSPTTPELHQATLAPILTAARQRWANAGLSSEQLAVIDSLRFEIADLAGWYLGSSSGGLVQLDRRATGYGWFIDSTPMEDEEFVFDSSPNGVRPSPAAERSDLLSASINPTTSTLLHVAAPGRIDLLSAVLHEMGHNLGLPDDYTPAARDNVMYGFLTPGERRLPVMDQARDARPDHDDGVHYVFAPFNIGNLPAGKSITITFRVTVANPMSPGTCLISNQGTVTANGGFSVLTDDPRTPAPLDATRTVVPSPPVAVTLPAADITGTTAWLNGTVNPCGTNTTYFFQYGTSPAYGSTTAPGALPGGGANVSVSASIAGLAAGATYHFRLIAANSLGTNAGANLTFTTPIEIVQQPAHTSACVGSTATFSVVASSTSVTYQWQVRAPGGAQFQNIPGAITDTYTTPAARAVDDGRLFRVVVSGTGTSITSAPASLSVIFIATPTIAYDFNSGLPAGTAIYGNAFINPALGVLELNPNIGSQNGAFLTTDLAPGRLVQGFAATFKARLEAGSASPADGFSFNWATDLPHGTYLFGEEGAGSGLRVAFDTWDNGAAEAPAIDVWWGTNLVARRPVTIPFLVRGPGFFDVQIRLTPDGLLDVSYACEPIFTRLPVTGYTPQMGARFGLGSRTGGAWESHGIDDLALQLFLDPTNGVPRITSISNAPPASVVIRGTGAPGVNVALHGSIDLNNWAWRANVTPDANGRFQHVEDPSLTPYRFYRLASSPQLPDGLVTYWRAENNLLDSFGPNHGSAFGVAPTFAPGQRGAAFSFDGTNHAMFIGGADIPPPWTAAFWVKRQDATEASAALLTSPSAGLKLEQWQGTRQVGFTAFGIADYAFNYIAPSNTWTHLSFVAAPAGTILYVNGTASETNAALINLPMNILGLRETGLDRMRGQVDETTIFRRALSPAEIRQVINATRGP